MSVGSFTIERSGFFALLRERVRLGSCYVYASDDTVSG